MTHGICRESAIVKQVVERFVPRLCLVSAKCRQQVKERLFGNLVSIYCFLQSDEGDMGRLTVVSTFELPLPEVQLAEALRSRFDFVS